MIAETSLFLHGFITDIYGNYWLTGSNMELEIELTDGIAKPTVHISHDIQWKLDPISDIEELNILIKEFEKVKKMIE